MRILLDECVPTRLSRALAGHEARSVADMGWTGRRNGDLISEVLAVCRDIQPGQVVTVG